MEFEIKNGKDHVKEFDNLGNLKFEGEYLNRERNGKEYYYDGKLELEYLDGKRNGIRKKYNYNVELKFEGVYFNGKKIEKE